MNKKIELLAPAGDLERAKVAIRFGADAVFIGGKQFSLRSRASNFDLEAISEAVKYAKQYGAHIHVTVNIIPHDEDYAGLIEYLQQLEAIGVTAIIVASLAILKLAKQYAPKLEVHVSTQMSNTNIESVRFYEMMQADRVVLARECNMEEIASVCRQTKMPIEAFIHGAMCTNYSGRCTLSNAMTLRDANRGGCAQSCRWKYHLLKDGEVISDETTPFSMSSKDLLACDYVYDMMYHDVASLKIEGRMKSAYYVATVVNAYRRLIDEIAEKGAPLSPDRMQYYRNEFTKAENRPTSLGFLHHQPNADDHLYGVNGAGVTHDFLGNILAFDETAMLATIEVRNFFKKGEIFEVFGPDVDNERFVVEHIINKDEEIIDNCNKPMEIVKVRFPFKVNVGDMIRRG